MTFAASPSTVPPEQTAVLIPSEAAVVPNRTRTPTRPPTASVSPSASSLFTKLRGEVTIAQAVCHYGPGAPYLYKYAVIQGSNLEIIARIETSDYIEVQAIGGNNPCWVRADYFKIKGDLMDLPAVQPEDVRLPQSPYYAPPGGVTAERAGTQVRVSWLPVVLRAGDDSEQTPYVVEAWVCRNGQLVFTPVGSYQANVEISDETGCALPSRARLTAAEKHGYTRWVDIPWPQAGKAPFPDSRLEH